VEEDDDVEIIDMPNPKLSYMNRLTSLRNQYISINRASQ